MNNSRLFPRYVNSFQVKDIVPTKEVQRNPLSYLQRFLTQGDRLVLNELIRLARIKSDIYIAHETIAKNIDKCRRTVQRAVAKLRSLGIVNYLYRPNKPSLYRPSSFLLLEWVRNSLKTIIPALSWISISFLTAGHFCFHQKLQSEMSHDINKNRFIYYQSKYIIDDTKDFLPQISRLETKMERVVNPIIQRLHNSLKFDDYCLTQLSQYSDKILLRAEKGMVKAKNIKNKPTYFLAICANEKLKGDNSPSDNTFKSKFSSKQPTAGSVDSGLYKEFKPVDKKQETLTDDDLDEKIMICEYKAKTNPFFGFVVTALANKFKNQS